ncbi:ATP-dependent RNA helicase HrpA [Tepidimonas charontis]|uniref:RNA helicase HrpA n=1 Tax=Tepidimonas charontis TaxID=2267262 RepID=A0A554XL33_9BURK|nr:ATP-dependent RNA helicase HrpA [Tepidimonas charontis]TSE36508.1 RNA helicase HrpA [Tepidimonas charontis]
MSQNEVCHQPAPPPVIEFPEALPVSARRADIEAALRAHPVIIVCGETGSGKTTQLPKIALAMGRGGGPHWPPGPGRRRPLIGHTQPRRLAATAVAARLAEETQTPLGELVGYQIRFHDRVQPGAAIKLMTDGILLAQTQRDPLLRAYDTLIIDEAHERSLNIDFLLGYLKQLLPRRPDLKVIITSATMDAQRFAEHFASAAGPAPIIEVSGRTYPVEVRWRPFEESRDYGLNEAMADAVDELWRGGAHDGDILVFLPGEREIREAADHLRRHLAPQPALRDTEVLPLYARLSATEQNRIFHPSGRRRIVLATNVAETSLTVPGIRYVIDSGLARIKRYSLRSKVEQLLVEPISQAAANQRAGRCGRVAEGICIRLYDERDFAARPRYTDPEILRSSLAGVILRMKALGLGDVEAFPFVDPPSRRAVTDGVQLLQELGALDAQGELTAVGRELARLPLDPRVGRMIVAARDRGALAEVLVIASALSVQDVRERPLEAQAKADQAHAAFDDERSEFVGLLKLWDWLEKARGGVHAPGEPPTHRLSQRQYEALLRERYIHVKRVREWRDIHQQLHTVAAEHGWKPNTQPASYEQIHLSLLAGLLGHVGCKHDTDDVYLGARGIKFVPHPGARLKKRPGRWVVCAELVETSRLFGRGLATIEPAWIEQVGAHLIKRQVGDPHWEKRSAEVVAYERGTLYGLTVYSQRRVAYARIDPAAAREIFIREALVAGLTEDTWDTRLPFWNHNRRVLREVQALEHKARRQDVLVDEALIYAFYDRQIPADVCDGRSLERWWREAVRTQPGLLMLSREELMRHEAAGITTDAYPPLLRVGGVDCRVSYHHEPGDARDGVTVEVPLFALNQVSAQRAEWLVPGLLREKVHALLKSLPQKPRARLVPLPETAQAIADALRAPERWAQGDLLDAVLAAVRERTGLPVQRTDFKLETLPAHLRMNFRLVDEHGRQLAMGRDLAALKAAWGAQARGAFQALAALRAAPAQASDAPAAAAGSGAAARPPVAAAGRAAGPVTAAGGGAGHAPAPHRPAPVAPQGRASAAAPASAAADGGAAVLDASTRHTRWDFGAWPELMEIRQGRQTLFGYPALRDAGDAVTVTVFDEPEEALRVHRQGLRRLFALQLRDTLKGLERSLSDLQRAAVLFMPLGTLEELRGQVLDLALERAYLTEPWPRDADAFAQRLHEGRQRLGLIAQEVARQAATIVTEWAAAQRKLRDAKAPAATVADEQQHLQRLLGKRFVLDIPWAQQAHLPRYLKAVQLRLDKARTDPARDAARLAELQPHEQRLWRLVAQRKGQWDERLASLRWMLEELRVSFFAQELRTPYPVSLKRLEKAWAQIDAA